MTDDSEPKCPKCGSDHSETAIRQYHHIGVVDVGWRCQSCGYQYGFEFVGS